MGNLGREMENKMRTGSLPNAEGISSITKTVEDFSHGVGKEVGSVIGLVSDRARDAVKSTKSYVEERPFQSVAIAAAAGVAVGSLLSFAMRRRK